MRGQGSLPSPLPHCFLSSVQLSRVWNSYFIKHKRKTHTKKPPATQARKTFFMLSKTCPKYIILLMVHITDENGRPYHQQNQYLPLRHNWTVCQRKNSPSWSVSMLWSRNFTFKRSPSFTWSDSSRFWFTNYQPGILKKENRKITKTFFFSLALFAITLLTFIRMRLRITFTANRKRLKTIIHLLLIQCLLCLSSAAPSVIQKPLVLCKNKKI